MSVYLDTSAFVCLYYPEIFSERVAQFVTECSLYFTPLHELETKNALMLKVFRKEADLNAAKNTMRLIEKDLKHGLLVRPSVDWVDIFRISVNLAEKHTGRVGSRSLDILHVATAQTIGVEQFLSFDDRQKVLAKKAGLNVVKL